MFNLHSLPVIASISLNRFTLDDVLSPSSSKRILEEVQELATASDFVMPPITKVQPMIDLVLLTPQCFGFNGPLGYSEFLDVAEGQGFKRCPDETALVFFESYDRIRNEFVEVCDFRGVCFASRLIKNKDSAGVIMRMRMWDDKKTLSTCYAEDKEGGFIGQDEKFLLVQPRLLLV